LRGGQLQEKFCDEFGLMASFTGYSTMPLEL